MAMTIVFARKATVLVDPREFDNDIQTPVAVNGRGYVTSTTPSAVLAIVWNSLIIEF
ncbi:10715_t:CDS:2 [Entrophospora sp. SA101]|nr:10715_t:CDS:2 [Entrophospora sp. SA101]CAJ0911937.1 9045_t:CDS:2 [Entrophospora sp. SA101]